MTQGERRMRRLSRRPVAGAVAALATVLAVTGCGSPRHHAAGQQAARPAPLVPTTMSASASASVSSATTPAGLSPTTTAAPAVPQDPASLAAALVAGERLARRPDAPVAQRAAAGETLALGYRQLGAHPDWVPAVVAAAAPDVRASVDRNARAALELRALTRPKDSLPPWRIVPPRDEATLLGYYREGEAATGVPWAVLAAVHYTETSFGRIHGDSSAGAQGPMQFLPSTWSAYGRGDINDDHDAILAAARYLHANGAPANLRAALYHYNHSDHYVNAVLLFAEEMNADTRAYSSYWFRPVVYSLVTGDVVLRETG